MFTVSVLLRGARYLVFNTDIWNVGSYSISWRDTLNRTLLYSGRGFLRSAGKALLAILQLEF